jgi:hypothetical protein
MKKYLHPYNEPADIYSENYLTSMRKRLSMLRNMEMLDDQDDTQEGYMHTNDVPERLWQNRASNK